MPFDVTSFVIEFEGGETSEAQVVEGFQHLINTGIAWQLQGSYGRTARNLIEAGICKPAGEWTPEQAREAFEAQAV